MANSSLEDTESQDDSQSNYCLVAGIEHSPDYFQLIGESLDQKVSQRKPLLHGQPCNKSKGRRKVGSLSDSVLEKLKKWVWKPKVNGLHLKYIKEFKIKCKFDGIKFLQLWWQR